MMTTEDIKRLKELDNSLAIALETNDKYQRENKDLRDQIKEAGKINQLHQELNEKLKTRAREAEGETSIIKAVGTNSPEIRDAQATIKELTDKCREAGRAMIELNMKYEANIKELDRLSEENTNLKVMLKGTDGRDPDNNS
jgi:uncharacterized protein with von Willebrand factor type A (vWA) domain